MVGVRAYLSDFGLIWIKRRNAEERAWYRALRLRSESVFILVISLLDTAAALIWTQETPRGFEFVCLDQNLREAALKEGFSIQPSY